MFLIIPAITSFIYKEVFIWAKTFNHFLFNFFATFLMHYITTQTRNSSHNPQISFLFFKETDGCRNRSLLFLFVGSRLEVSLSVHDVYNKQKRKFQRLVSSFINYFFLLIESFISYNVATTMQPIQTPMSSELFVNPINFNTMNIGKIANEE